MICLFRISFFICFLFEQLFVYIFPALEEKMFGRIIVFNGASGEILHWMPTPDRRESYYPPQILENSKGEKSILFGTGGNSRPGSLYVISMKDLANKKISKVSFFFLVENLKLVNPLFSFTS